MEPDTRISPPRLEDAVNAENAGVNRDGTRRSRVESRRPAFAPATKHKTMADQANRTCKGCRLSKIKCDLSSVGGPRCSRCSRLNLDCVQESRRGSSGRSRLKSDGAGALKRDITEARPATIIEKLTRTALVSARAQQILAAPLLRRCGQEAWSRNDTKLMAWVLEQAAVRSLPLADFAPALFSAAPPGQLEPAGTGTPPPFIRALLGGGYSDALGVAFHQSGTRTDWISNDSFDQRVCSRRALHDARSCHIFTPADEVERFEREVVAELIETLTPALGGADAEALGETAGALCSEVVDTTRLWRLRLQDAAPRAQVCDEWVVCKVVMRMVVLRGGEDVWMVGSYVPQITDDGSWVTSKEAPRAMTAASPPRKRRAKSSEEDALEPPPAASPVPCGPVAALAELHADSLLHQLQATSTEDLLRMLDEEEELGGAQLG